MTTRQESPQHVKASPSLRPARLDDYRQIEPLELSFGLLTIAASDWPGFWYENPLRRQLGANWPIGWVLEDANGRLVGSLVNIPTRYVIGGQELIAATGRAWVVRPEYRGIALWLMDEYFQQEGVDLFINTTVNAMAVDPFATFGSSRVPVGDWETALYWITGYRGFAASALRLKKVPQADSLAPLAAAALRVKDTLTAVKWPAAAKSVVIEEASEFHVSFDAFWEELIRQNPGKLLAQRDCATLSWHFGRPLRAGQAWIYTASRGGRLRAYGVLKRHDHPASGLRRMRLVDFQTLEPDVDHLSGLLRFALHRCVAEGIHILEHVGGDLPKMQSFDRFAPYRRKLSAWSFFYKAVDPALDALLRKPETWDPSVYDGDASL